MHGMDAEDFNPGASVRRDWGKAFAAIGRLLADGDDTMQVFRIMRALNGDVAMRNYRKLLSTAQGGVQAYRRVELAELFSDRAWLDTLPEGTVGATYRAFLDRTGYSAGGLAEVSYEAHDFMRAVEHPYAWMGRRERDIHDIWHVLTGYAADEHLGELCLSGFSFGQTDGWGWGAIAWAGGLKTVATLRTLSVLRAIAEGRRLGRRAAWLHAEEYKALLAEPLDHARRRLRIGEPRLYRAAQAELAARGITRL